jgi:hypothetical protein
VGNLLKAFGGAGYGYTKSAVLFTSLLKIIWGFDTEWGVEPPLRGMPEGWKQGVGLQVRDFPLLN